jgi:hypothetical protein
MVRDRAELRMNAELSTIYPEVLDICCELAITNDHGLFTRPIRSETIEQLAAQRGISVQSVDTAITVLHRHNLLRKERPYKPYLIHLTLRGIKSYLRTWYPNFEEIKQNVARALIGRYLPNDEQLVATIQQPRWLIVAALAALEEEGLLSMQDRHAHIEIRHISAMLRLRYARAEVQSA